MTIQAGRYHAFLETTKTLCTGEGGGSQDCRLTSDIAVYNVPIGVKRSAKETRVSLL